MKNSPLFNEEEEVLLEDHPHWTFMAGAVAMVVAAVLITIVLTAMNPQLGILGLLLILVSAAGLLGRFLRWRTTKIVLTTDRVVLCSGIINKTGIEFPLDKVMNISYRQAFWQRFVNSGEVTIESVGDHGHQKLAHAPDPIRLQRVIYRQVEVFLKHGPTVESEERTGSDNFANDAPSEGGADIPDQIEKLDSLRQRGIISREEFARKKQDLLDKM